MKVVYIIIGLILSFFIFTNVYRIVNIDSDLVKKVENGAIILDVRTESEYESGHIEGAVNISLGNIRERYIELDTSKTYITYCSHGMRSVKVKSIMKEKGFKNVYNGGAQSDIEKLLTKAKQQK